MKTLDEVIDNFEKACDLERRCENCSGCLGQENGCPYDGAESVPDALHYLKEYRDYRNANKTVTQDGSVAEAENEPLTWDELKQMEGKPVWVEWTKTEESYWCFVGEWFDDDEMRIYHIGRAYADYIHKTIYTPDIVQSFRKGRE